MGNYFYAQLGENNICVGVSSLSGEVDEYIYHTPRNFNPLTGEFEFGEAEFVSRMRRIPVYSENYIGLRWNDDLAKWEQPEAD